jgi:hypothetical protein
MAVAVPSCHRATAAAQHVYAHCLRLIHFDWIASPSRLRARLQAQAKEVHGSNEWCARCMGPFLLLLLLLLLTCCRVIAV